VPLYLVVPLFCGLGVGALWTWSKLLAVALVAALLVPNLMLYGLPGSPLRAGLTAELASELRVCDLLERKHIQMVYGDYFWVYHLNFDSRERIAGIPKLGTSPLRWGLLGGSDEVHRLAGSLHARGALTRDGDLWLFISDRPASNAARLLVALRRVSWSP
jgi:hypothetical protein